MNKNNVLSVPRVASVNERGEGGGEGKDGTSQVMQDLVGLGEDLGPS